MLVIAKEVQFLGLYSFFVQAAAIRPSCFAYAKQKQRLSVLTFFKFMLYVC
jgi:hypothetical protein